MSDKTVVVVEQIPCVCKICGSPPSRQVFGPTQYIQGTVEILMCSNHEKLKGTCKSTLAYMSLEDWNQGNSEHVVPENAFEETSVLRDLVSTGDTSIADLIRYHATCKKALVDAGLWTDNLQTLRNKASAAIDSLIVPSRELGLLPEFDVEYDDSDESVAVRYKDGKVVHAMRDGSVIVGQVPCALATQNKPFVKYDFSELASRTFEFSDMSVSCKVDKHPYISEITHTLVDGTTVLLKANGELVIKEPDGNYPLETTIEKLLKTPATLQKRKDEWMRTCFTDEITDDPKERNRRFLEEALELVQALNMSRYEAHFMVDYVFDRDKGEPFQEVGGSILTLAALCTANKIDLMNAAETELARVWTKVGVIRGKQKQKPNFLEDLDWIIKNASSETLQSYANANVEELAKALFMKSADMSLRYSDPLAGLNLAIALSHRAGLIVKNDKGYIEPFKD